MVFDAMRRLRTFMANFTAPPDSCKRVIFRTFVDTSIGRTTPSSKMLMPQQLAVIRDSANLNAATLADRVRCHGAVIFQSSPDHQLTMTINVTEILGREGIKLASAETPGNLGVMCLVDVSRFSLSYTVEAAAEVLRHERRQGLAQSGSPWHHHIGEQLWSRRAAVKTLRRLRELCLP